MTHELRDVDFSALVVGMTASFDIKITEAAFDNFRNLTCDFAPVHHDANIARSMGYDRPIVYGFMVFGQFSGLLGMVFPGPRTVIHSASFQMKKPVFIGDQLTYVTELKKIHGSVKVVVLDLAVYRNKTELVMKGETQCGFRR